MKPALHRLALAATIAFFMPMVAATSQTTETPVPFDSAGRIRVVTPALVARLSLAGPDWPASQAFTEAKLYQSSSGGFVIVAVRADGTIDRYPLTSEQRTALSRAMATAMVAKGNLASDGVTSAEASQRSAFVRNQTLLTAVVYAPAAASLADGAKARTAIWLLGTGGSYFALSALTRNAHITRAQNHLSTDGGLRGALLMNGLLQAFGADLDNDLPISAGLAGALGGAILGYHTGKHMTDAEAHAATTISTFSGLTGLGLTGAFGGIDDRSNKRALAGIGVATAVAGYAIGPLYARKSSYAVTAGDLGIMHITAALGIAASAIPFIDRGNVNQRTLAGALTAGMLTGLATGDLFFTRPFDHTDSDAWRVGLGGLAGGLVGGAAAVLTEPNLRGGVAMVVGSALIGTVVTQKLIRPLRAKR